MELSVTKHRTLEMFQWFFLMLLNWPTWGAFSWIPWTLGRSTTCLAAWHHYWRLWNSLPFCRLRNRLFYSLRVTAGATVPRCHGAMTPGLVQLSQTLFFLWKQQFRGIQPIVRDKSRCYIVGYIIPWYPHEIFILTKDYHELIRIFPITMALLGDQGPQGGSKCPRDPRRWRGRWPPLLYRWPCFCKAPRSQWSISGAVSPIP